MHTVDRIQCTLRIFDLQVFFCAGAERPSSERKKSQKLVENQRRKPEKRALSLSSMSTSFSLFGVATHLDR